MNTKDIVNILQTTILHLQFLMKISETKNIMKWKIHHTFNESLYFVPQGPQLEVNETQEGKN